MRCPYCGIRYDLHEVPWDKFSLAVECYACSKKFYLNCFNGDQLRSTKRPRSKVVAYTHDFDDPDGPPIFIRKSRPSRI